ncbi:MAG: response regulator [Planctomycetota bacterium]|nr:MAG: response regulator [Planctomycetota bacterium]
MKKVLIVDDSAMARMMIKKCLEIADAEVQYEYFEAEDGDVAMEMLSKESFDLLISDLNMPRITGEMLIKGLKKNGTIQDLPVILISSKINDSKVEELMGDGAIGVLKKPLTPTVLHKFIKNKREKGLL